MPEQRRKFQLNDTARWAVLIGLGAIAFYVVTVSGQSAQLAVSSHERKQTGSHPATEYRIRETEKKVAVLSNDMGHIKHSLSELETDSKEQKALMIQILRRMPTSE